MRKVTQNARNAFMNPYPQNWAEGSTTVSPSNGEVFLYLHGHIIAIRNKAAGSIQITNAGWFTNVTKERLNALPGVSIQEVKGVWYLNGKEWDGSLITI